MAFNCPPSRATVRARRDLDAYDISFDEIDPPSEEVKADPERPSLWRKQREQRREDRSSGPAHENTASASSGSFSRAVHTTDTTPTTVLAALGLDLSARIHGGR